jgi:hypothetical protein
MLLRGTLCHTSHITHPSTHVTRRHVTQTRSRLGFRKGEMLAATPNVRVPQMLQVRKAVCVCVRVRRMAVCVCACARADCVCQTAKRQALAL